MTTTLKIDGGVTTNVASYSVTEDATPVAAHDNRGGVGSLIMDFADFEGADELAFQRAVLEDTYNGVTSGVVNSVDGDGYVARFDATSRLSALVNDVTVAPFVGTLGTYLTNCLAVVGVFEDIDIDPVTAGKSVAYIGWSGILWDKLKELAVLHRFEISLVSDRVTVRPLRGRLAENANNESIKWKVDTGNLVCNFTVANYNLQAVTNQMVYPVSLADAAVISFQPGEAFETTVDTGVSLTAVQQPVVTEGLGKYTEGNESVYTVIDGSGRSISADEWRAMDGYLTVEIDPEDPAQSRIIIRAGGGGDTDTGPYKLALQASEESSTDYSTVRIFGSGVRYSREVLLIETGVPKEYANSIDGPTIDTIFSANRGDAFRLAGSAIAGLTSPTRTVNVVTSNINRRGESGALDFPTYADFAAEYAGTSYAQFKTLMGSTTYEEFYEEYMSRSIGNFENQAFGNVAGARVRFTHAFMRIVSADIDEAAISYVAEADTTFSDFAAEIPAGMTYADFAALWGSKTYIDFGAKPLWH